MNPALPDVRAVLPAVAAGVCAPALAVILLDGGSAPGAFAVACLLLGYGCFRLTGLVLSGRCPPVAVAFWTFVVVYWCIASLIQLSSGLLPWRDTDTSRYYLPAQLLALVVCACFELAYLVTARGTDPSGALPASPGRAGGRRKRREPDPRALERALAALLVLSAGLTALSVVRTGGGVAARFQSRTWEDTVDAPVTVGTTGQGLLVLLPAALVLTGVVLSVVAVRTRWSGAPVPGRGRVRALVVPAGLLCGFLAVASVVANPMSSTRYISFSVVLAALFAVAAGARPALRGAVAAAIPLGLAVVYPALNVLDSTQEQLRAFASRSIYTSVDFDGFQQTVNAVSSVDANGTAHGRYLASVLLFFVPRSVWPDKAVPASIDVAAFRGYSFQNLSLPLWAEIYLDLGVVAAAAALAGLGILAGRLDARGTRGPGNGALAAVLAGTLMGFVRGPMGAQFPFFAVATVATIGILAWCRREPPGADEAAGPPGDVRRAGERGSRCASSI